jgi:hypothetical protein
MPRWRPISLGGGPGVGGKWDARADAPAKDPLRLEARSSGPEDLRVAVFHGDREVGRVVFLPGGWRWSLRGGGHGRAPSREAALQTLARTWAAQR